MNVSLTRELERLVNEKVESGLYQTASEVIRESLRLRPVVPVVRLSGVIGVATPLRPGLMLSTIARSLERAFATRNARAVALVINSPGGSPAQSHLIFRRIRQWSEEKKIPVLAFILRQKQSVRGPRNKGGRRAASHVKRRDCGRSLDIGKGPVLAKISGTEQAQICRCKDDSLWP